MKKTYIAPSIMVREVELADIIATSLNFSVGDGVILSREMEWDWDEDEEYDF